jgi:hypothetical protein
MKIRSLLVLVLLTAAAVTAATVAVIRHDRPATISSGGDRLFPDLLDSLDRIATVSVRHAGGALTIERSPPSETSPAWRLKERGGYPVDADKVRAVVIGLASLEKVEPKTAQPDRYARLGVEDVDAVGAGSREVSLFAADGRPLARLIVGEAAASVGDDAARYVRIPGEARAWLVRGGIDPGREPSDWIHRELTNLPAAVLKQIVVRRPGAPALTAVRPTAESEVFAVSGLPSGARIKDDRELGGIASVLAALELEDMRPADGFDFAAGSTVRGEFTTFGGLVVTVDVADVGGEAWARFSARGVPVAGVVDATAAEQAAALNARLAGWAYRLPQWKVAPLRRGWEELIERGR